LDRYQPTIGRKEGHGLYEVSERLLRLVNVPVFDEDGHVWLTISVEVSGYHARCRTETLSDDRSDLRANGRHTPAWMHAIKG
jgi:hypothetical protein